MTRYFVWTGIFPSDPIKLVWYEPDGPFCSILKAYPQNFTDWNEAEARARELNRLGVDPAELMSAYVEAKGNGGDPFAIIRSRSKVIEMPIKP